VFTSVNICESCREAYGFYGIFVRQKGNASRFELVGVVGNSDKYKICRIKKDWILKCEFISDSLLRKGKTNLICFGVCFFFSFNFKPTAKIFGSFS